MNDLHSRNECVDHPLGILCRCDEYRKIAKKFVVNTVGTVSCMSPNKIHFEEPIAPVAIIWTLEKTEANANPTKPILQYDSKKINKIHYNNIDRAWIPVNTSLVSSKCFGPRKKRSKFRGYDIGVKGHGSARLFKLLDIETLLRLWNQKNHVVYVLIVKKKKFRRELRRNTSYLHRTSPTSQSADISVLTDMLPHRGRAIKRRDIDWYIGSHTTPVEMTDEPEMNFSSVRGCFSNWAQAYTLATGRPAY